MFESTYDYRLINTCSRKDNIAPKFSQMFLLLQIYALNKLMTEWENEAFINFKESNSGAPV